MPIRTIIINGDASWNFSALLWSQGLDLFRRDSGLFFRNCAADTTVSVDPRILLGNFPDDFSTDAFALIDEMQDDIRSLATDPDEQLNVCVILSRVDLAQLVGSASKLKFSKAQHEVALTPAGDTAVEGLKALMKAVRYQTQTEEDMAPLVTRLWISLVVRDGGQLREDNDLAKAAISYFSAGSGRCRVHSVFFLSNGVDQDRIEDAAARHFAKLRILIDLYRSTDADQRRAIRDIEVPAGLWLQMPPGQMTRPSVSAELRRALVAVCERLRGEFASSIDPDVMDHFRTFTQDLQALLPGLAGDNFTRTNAASALDGTVVERIQSARDASARAEATQDARDVATILAELRPRGRSFLPRYNSTRRREAWARLEAEYESACRSTSTVYETVVEESIALDRKKGAVTQQDLENMLSRVRIPTGLEGEKASRAFRERLNAVDSETVAEIQAAEDNRMSLAIELKAEKSRRARAFSVLDRAEDQLIRWTTIGRMLAVFALFLVPVVADFIGRNANGMASPVHDFFDVIRLLGPFGFFVWVSVLLLTLAVGFLLLRLSRLHGRVLKDVRTRLQLNYDWLKEQYAARFSVAYNRQRLSLVQQTRIVLSPKVRTDVATAVEKITQRLQIGNDVRNRAVDGREILVQEAMEAFAKKRDWQSRIAAFLISARPGDPSSLTVMADDWPEPRLFQSATLTFRPIPGQDLTLALRRPGDVR